MARWLRLGLALFVESILLGLLGIWLGRWMTPLPRTASLGVTAIHWMRPIVRAPIKTRVHVRAMPRRVGRVSPPRMPSLAAFETPSAWGHVLRLLRKSLKQGNGVHIPEVQSGAGGLAHVVPVQIPIPGAGGLFTTGLRVIQTHLACYQPFAFKYIAHRGYQWIAGRVNTSGRVISVRDFRRFRVSRAHATAYLTLVRKWRFAPLRINGHPTWFHIVVVIWWGPGIRVIHLRHPLFPGHRSRCFRFSFDIYGDVFYSRVPNRDRVMPHWILYPLKGHHPLAVLLAAGPDPTLGIAQAVALFLRQLQNKH